MSVPGRVLLGLEQGVKVPEAALHKVLGGHLREASTEHIPYMELGTKSWNL